jgi:hypothetical protein
MKPSTQALLAAVTAALFLFSGSAIPIGEVVGLVSKAILDVTRLPVDGEWSKAERGQPLVAGDRLRTGNRSFAIIKFNDNSMVRIREESEVALTATKDGAAFSKQVDVRSGGVGFEVTRQRAGEEFRFSTPTSVASIRGTAGALSTGEADTLVLLNGVASYRNVFSSRQVNVTDGITAIARRDGTIEMRPSTREERQAAETAAKTGDRPQQLKLELRNSDGEVKDLIIDYKE